MGLADHSHLVNVDGYVSDSRLISFNNVVKFTITIQRTATATWTEKEIAST